MDADETIAAAIAHIDAQVRAAEAKGYRAGLVDGEKKGLARAREILKQQQDAWGTEDPGQYTDISYTSYKHAVELIDAALAAAGEETP